MGGVIPELGFEPWLSIGNQPVLAREKVWFDTIFVHSGLTVLATNLNGEIQGRSIEGFFTRDTRFLSRYLWKIDGQSLDPVAIEPLTYNKMLGYHLAKEADHPNVFGSKIPKNSLEVRISRAINEGMAETLILTNHSREILHFEFSLELEADFSDINEILDHNRQQLGLLTMQWQGNQQRMQLDYHIQGIHHGLIFAFQSNIPGRYHAGEIRWHLELKPHQTFYLSNEISIVFCGDPLKELYPMDQKSTLMQEWLSSATHLETSNMVVKKAFDSSKADLGGLRIWSEDQGTQSWIPAAGLPIYLGVFGRDVLTAGWQAGLLGPEMMQGAIKVMRKYQATERNPWRDEEPGKMIHEIELGPMSLLDKLPYKRYYGSTTSTPLFIIMLSELYHWVGDIKLLEENRDALERALSWIDNEGDLDGDGFYEYKTCSSQGLRNQGWKDSSEAIVYGDGRLADPPIATCEEQAWVYDAKVRAALIYTVLKEFGKADKLIDEAYQLKSHFNKAFWMPEKNYYALGLDPEKRQIDSITSNPGHCLVTGIIEDDKAALVIGRMVSPDLFSGWGVRTLSNEHPNYNPFSYQLGSVWPVENGTFALGFVRYGFYEQANLLAEAIFSTSAVFEHGRLPEVVSGHPRHEESPIPAAYPRSCIPQAWSSSAIPVLVQAMLGLYPYAPLNALFLDPHLPEWLPELTLNHLRVGHSEISLHFWRASDGKTHHRVLGKTGTLRIIPHWFNIHRLSQLAELGVTKIAKW